jgi:two-component system, sensor histidine kinase LadS
LLNQLIWQTILKLPLNQAHRYIWLLLLIWLAGCKRDEPALYAKMTTISNVSCLGEGNSPWQAIQAFDSFSANRFTPLHTTNINLGRVKERFWFHFTIYSSQMQYSYLELSNPFIYSIELYNTNKSYPQLLTKTGIDLPFFQRPVLFRHFVLPLLLHPGQNNFLLLCDRREELLRFSLKLYTPEAFRMQQDADYLFFGCVFGILALISLFSFTLLVVLKERIYFYYLCYISLMFLFIVTDNGFGYQWIWSNFPIVQKYIRNFISLAAFGVHLQFMPLLLGLPQTSPYLNRWIRRVSLTVYGLLLLFSLGVVFEKMAIPVPELVIRLVQLLFYSCFIAGITLILSGTLQLIIRGNRTAQIYFLATLPLIIQILIVIFSRWHLIHTDIDTAKLLAVSIVMEIIVLSIGLILRYYYLRKEKEVLARELDIQKHANMITMLSTQEAERKRIAEDLHDHLGGTLSALKGMLSGLSIKDPVADQQLTYAQSMLDEACYDIRSIAHNLMPANFENITLAEALEESVRKFNRYPHSHFHFLTCGNPIALTKETELHIFRIANELLNNILKHAKATDVTLQLLYYPDMIELMIEDNGMAGFDPEPSRKSKGIGLKSLYSRADCINATIRYDSSPEGTTVICTIPRPNP